MKKIILFGIILILLSSFVYADVNDFVTVDGTEFSTIGRSQPMVVFSTTPEMQWCRPRCHMNTPYPARAFSFPLPLHAPSVNASIVAQGSQKIGAVFVGSRGFVNPVR